MFLFNTPASALHGATLAAPTPEDFTRMGTHPEHTDADDLATLRAIERVGAFLTKPANDPKEPA